MSAIFSPPVAELDAVFKTRPDSISEWARQKCGLPAGWRWVTFSGHEDDAPPGTGKFFGAVCPTRRDGSPNWSKRDKSTERTLFISFAELREFERELGRREGKCWNCWGTGWQWSGCSVKDGNRYRECLSCGGSGTPAREGNL